MALVEVFAEVADEVPMPAADTRSVAFHLAKERTPRVRELVGLTQHGAPSGKVASGVDQDALGLQAVAAGATRFLLVVLERLGRTGVEDEPHVGAIDAHPECDGGNDKLRLFVEERILMAVPLVV
jgi:hypothetical protein